MKMLIFCILPINSIVSVTLCLSLSHPDFCLQVSCTCIPDTWTALSHYFSTAVLLYTTYYRLPSVLYEILLLWPPTFSFALTFLLGTATHFVWVKYTVIFANPNYVMKYSLFLSFYMFSRDEAEQCLIWIHIAQENIV